jgi:NADPH-dependent ferric siderophore reductase
MSDPDLPTRVRREPPTFRRVTVQAVTPVTPRLRRVTLHGDELAGLVVDQPAASVRLLLPAPESSQLVIPTWNGNEFLFPDGSRPAIRTLTPLRVDAAALTLDVEIVLHGGGAASEWAAAAAPGAEAAVSGPGRGYEIDAGAPSFFLAGDETALPAIGQLLEQLPSAKPAHVHVEIAHAAARVDVAEHATVAWHELPEGSRPGDALVAAVDAAEIATDTHVWVAGEAAAVQRIRRDLIEARGFSRRQAVVRGYWKHGRTGDGE